MKSFKYIKVLEIITEKLGKIENLLNYYEMNNPMDVKKLLEEANAAYLQGELDSAEMRYLLAHEISPQNANVIRGLLSIYEDRGDKDALINFYRKLVRLKPKETLPVIQLAGLYREIFGFSRSKNFLEERLNSVAWREDSKSILTLELAWDYFHLGNYRQSKRLCEGNEEESEVLSLYASIAKEQGNHEDAVEYARQVLLTGYHCEVASGILRELAPSLVDGIPRFQTLVERIKEGEIFYDGRGDLLSKRRLH